MKQININSISPQRYLKLAKIAKNKGLKVSTLCRVWIYERLDKER